MINKNFILSLIIFISCAEHQKNKIEETTVDLSIEEMFLAKTGDFTPEIKDSLLKVKHIIFSYKDEGEILEETHYLHIDSVKNTLCVESTENLTSSFVGAQYRAVSLLNREKLIYSKTVGSRSSIIQAEFGVYDYDSTSKKLVLDTISTTSFDVKFTDFFKPNTPDSIISSYKRKADLFYNIISAKRGIAEYVLSQRIIDKNNNEWIIGNIITFDIKEDIITITKPYKRD